MIATEHFAMPKLGDACASDLDLDRAVATGAPAAALSEHLVGCARCQARFDAFSAFSAQTRPQVARLIESAQARSPQAAPAGMPAWLMRIGMPALVGACAVVVFLAVPDPDTTRVKGSAMSFFVQRDGEVTRAVSGDRFREGDAFRFFVDNPAGRFFMLAGVSGDGEVTVFYPRGGDSAVPLRSDEEIPIDASLILDDDTDREYVVGVVAHDQVTTATVAAAIRNAMRGAPRLEPAMLADVDMRATLHWVVLNKAAGSER